MRLVVDDQRGISRASGLESEHAWVPGLMELMGLTDAGAPIRVLLAPESSPLARGVPAWVSGYTDGRSDAVVLLTGRTPSYPDGALEEVLAHEVAHVLLYRASAGHEVPRWFNEGLAMMAGRSWGLRDRTQLGLGLLSGERVPLWKLDTQFQGDRVTVERAYALSGALVQDLLERHGNGLPRALLSRVARGLSFEEALRQATGATLIDVGESFYERQTVWRRWLPIVASTAALWFGIATLAILAAVKRRRRNRLALTALGLREEAAEPALEDDEPAPDEPPAPAVGPPVPTDFEHSRHEDWPVN
ncbi:MAG: hypothetical protein ABIT01_15770 [Thermoanaerobaculia bacterium]